MTKEQLWEQLKDLPYGSMRQNDVEAIFKVVDAYYKDVEVVDYIWCNWKKPIIDIVSLFIGKDYCLRHYFEGLEKLDYPKDRINLIWHDTSHILKFTEKLSKWITDNGNKYRSVNLIQCRDPHFHFEEENQTGDTLYIITEAYNHALNYCKSDYFLAFEDDMIPPPDGLNKLLDIVKGDVKGACGVNLYRPSIPGFNQTPILWNFEKKETFPGEGIEAEFDAVKIDNLGTGIEFIGSGHLGFTLLNGDWLRENKFKLKIGKVVGCDINLGNRMRLQNYKYAIDWSIKCKHYDIDGNYV